MSFDLKISCSLELLINALNVYVKFAQGKYSSWRWICLIFHTSIVLAFFTMLLAYLRIYKKIIVAILLLLSLSLLKVLKRISTPTKMHLSCLTRAFILFLRKYTFKVKTPHKEIWKKSNSCYPVKGYALMTSRKTNQFCDTSFYPTYQQKWTINLFL